MATAIGFFGAAAIFAAQSSDNIGVDQISAPTDATETKQIILPTQRKQGVGVDQLPETLEPASDGDEGQLGRTAAPERTLTSEVLAAWSLIRERGQTPTPDLIAREIGPDKLAEFLATNPAAGNILATGVEPDSSGHSEPAQKSSDSFVILPPGKG
ncbi:MAG: hypothetical protein ACRCY3_05530 [Sphingorhabdus sp.]